jgi:hypothetical protein
LDVAGKYKAAEDGNLTVPGFGIHELTFPTPEGVMDQEEAYIKALMDAATCRLVGNCLEIADAAGEVILVFTR